MTNFNEQEKGREFGKEHFDDLDILECTHETAKDFLGNEMHYIKVKEPKDRHESVILGSWNTKQGAIADLIHKFKYEAKRDVEVFVE